MSIIVDGVYAVSTSELDSASALYVSGNKGGGVLTLGYKVGDQFVPYLDDDDLPVVMNVDKQYEIRHGRGKNLYVSLTGSTGASVAITSNGIA